VLVDWLDDPVYSWVAANDCVLRVDENDFEIFVGRVLVDPIGIEDSEICAAAADTLFGCGFERSLIFELVDTLVRRFAVGSTLWRRPLATTSSDTNAVDHITLLRFVAQAASLVRARGSGSAVDDLELTELPAADSEKKSQNVGLLLFVKLFDVFEGTHLVGRCGDRLAKICDED